PRIPSSYPQTATPTSSDPRPPSLAHLPRSVGTLSPPEYTTSSSVDGLDEFRGITAMKGLPGSRSVNASMMLSPVRVRPLQSLWRAPGLMDEAPQGSRIGEGF
ncbi:Hypothetical protein FKW44_025381, partial [Caligus rogercresseyi]